MELLWHFLPVLLALCCFPLPKHHVRALDLDLGNAESIKSAARAAADGMMKYYNGNTTAGIPGLLPGPYYWWEAGAMFGQMIQFWYYTGDPSYNDVVTEGLLFQVGPKEDYEPPNQTKAEGNDDQVFWGFACLDAAELKFPDPPKKQPQWLALAQAIFNRQTNRWDDLTCGGGLRWQFNWANKGYDYKNSISNGGFFQLAARLARYTRNDTYADWANKMYDWMAQSPLISRDYEVFDGTSVNNNCSDANHIQWTYNSGTMIAGSAYMYNYTNGSTIWKERLQGFITLAARNFFPAQYGGTIMYEGAMDECERIGQCTIDQPSFRAYLGRWLATTVQLAPWTYDQIIPLLQGSAQAAAKSCTGGDDGRQCGRKWVSGAFDGLTGVGEQMSAMSVIQANLITKVHPPVDERNGTSKGNPNAGTGDEVPVGRPITTSDRAGAWILTLMALGLTGWLVWFLIFSPDGW